MSNADRPIAILSAGRAGSTLLQKLLNTHPELAIFGEHAGFLIHLARAWDAVHRAHWIPEVEASGRWLLDPSRPLRPEHWAAWDGSFSRRQFDRSLRHWLDDLFAADVPEGMRWGFKEIRYRDVKVLEMLSSLYAGVRFVLLLRNPVDACVSFAAAGLQGREATGEEIKQVVSATADARIRPFIPFAKDVQERFAQTTTTVIYEELEKEAHPVVAELAAFLELEGMFDHDAISSIADTQLVSQRQSTSPERLELLRAAARDALADEQAWYAELRSRRSAAGAL